MRTAFFFLLMLSVATSVAAADDTANAEASPQATAGADAAAEEVPVEEEQPPPNCTPNELQENIDAWSVDCVELWLMNLGFPELRGAFAGNKMDGVALKGLTMAKLAEDYGVSDEDQRKKIYYNLKDVLRKDGSSGNTNHYSQMFFWCLPFLGLYKWFSLKYEKQIEKAQKKYQKWQEKRNPPKPVEIKTYADGTNEWISGMNSDLGGNTGAAKNGNTGAAKKKDKKDGGKDKKKKAAKAE
jgi:hypothetical protein